MNMTETGIKREQAHVKGRLRWVYVNCCGKFPHVYDGVDCQACEKDYLVRAHLNKCLNKVDTPKVTEAQSFVSAVHQLVVVVGEWLVMKFGGHR